MTIPSYGSGEGEGVNIDLADIKGPKGSKRTTLRGGGKNKYPKMCHKKFVHTSPSHYLYMNAPSVNVDATL